MKSREGRFFLVLRFYWPEESMLDGSGKAPVMSG